MAEARRRRPDPATALCCREPSWVKDVARLGIHASTNQGSSNAIASALIFALLAVGALVQRLGRPSVIVVVIAATLLWVFVPELRRRRDGSRHRSELRSAARPARAVLLARPLDQTLVSRH